MAEAARRADVSYLRIHFARFGYNEGERPVPYLPEFLESRNGKVWPNDRQDR